MSIHGTQSQDVRDRISHRLHRRHLRWLARQPVESVFLSQGWRSFWRSCRRRATAFFESRLVQVPAVCLAVCGLLFALAVAAKLVSFLPEVFFAAPEDHSFANPAQRATVALTRLTIFQSAMLSLLFFGASRCFCGSAGLERGRFYEKYDTSELVGYRIFFLCFLACSAAVAVGATIGHGANVYGVAASLTVTGCLGWLAWTAGKRLMAFRWPPWILSAEAAAGGCLLLLPLFLVALNIWIGSPILSLSRRLNWLGPCGWVNDLLLGLSSGQTQNLWPLGICCVVAVSLGCWLNGPTGSWAFRRRLLSKYRIRESRRRATTNTTGEQRVAHDLRQALSGKGWKSILYPPWMKGHVTALLLLCGTVFLLQLALAGLVLFLESFEQAAGSGQPLNEKRMMCAHLASVAGWSVLLMEVLAARYRDQAGLVEFARRPVSPGQVWKRLQLDGVKFAPTQVLLAIPFVALTTVVAPEYSIGSCIAVMGALFGCIAIRTTWSAGSCYFPSIMRLRPWITSILLNLGMVAGCFLILGTVLSASGVWMVPDWSPGKIAVSLLLQQLATLTALGIAWGTWYAVGHSGKATQFSSNVG